MRNVETLLVCPVCSGSFESNKCKRIVYPTDTLDNKFPDKPHSILFCNNCGVGIAFPRLTDEQFVRLYSRGGYWRNAKIEVLAARKFPGHYTLARARWDFVKSFITKKWKRKSISILDIGAGHGFFGMVVARDKSISLRKYCTVETDKVLSESLKKTWQKYFPEVIFEGKDFLNKVEREYNLVIMSNILEHLDNPKYILNEAIERLAKDGLLFVDVPNQDYLFKGDAFPHLVFFNKHSLETLLKKTRLEIRHISCYGKNMKYSPINYRNNKKIFVKIAVILHKIRFIIPSQISRAFFSWYFGVNKKNVNGVWLRAIGQRCVKK